DSISTFEVPEEDRARQLARKYLREIGMATTKNVDLLQDVIIARKWSAAQVQVQVLVDQGCSIPCIYSAFELSNAWRENSMLDEQLDLGNGRGLRNSPRISWREAAVIVRYVGEDASLDELLSFVEAEHQRWQQSTRYRSIFPSFKHYLFDH